MLYSLLTPIPEDKPPNRHDNASVKRCKKSLGASVWSMLTSASKPCCATLDFMCVPTCGIAFTQSPTPCNPQTILERARHNSESVPSDL